MNSKDGWTGATVDEVMEAAKRYCMQSGRTWIMKNDKDRYLVINPYAPDVEEHYLSLPGWSVEAELTTEVKVEMQPAKYRKGEPDNECKMRYVDDAGEWVVVRPGDWMWSLVTGQKDCQYWSVQEQKWCSLADELGSEG